jgi:hypothetical protein
MGGVILFESLTEAIGPALRAAFPNAPSIILETPRFDGGIQFYGRFPNRHIGGRIENRYALSYCRFRTITFDALGGAVPAGDLAQTI